MLSKITIDVGSLLAIVQQQGVGRYHCILGCGKQGSKYNPAFRHNSKPNCHSSRQTTYHNAVYPVLVVDTKLGWACPSKSIYLPISSTVLRVIIGLYAILITARELTRVQGTNKHICVSQARYEQDFAKCLVLKSPKSSQDAVTVSIALLPLTRVTIAEAIQQIKKHQASFWLWRLKYTEVLCRKLSV